MALLFLGERIATGGKATLAMTENHCQLSIVHCQLKKGRTRRCALFLTGFLSSR